MFFLGGLLIGLLVQRLLRDCNGAWRTVFAGFTTPYIGTVPACDALTWQYHGDLP